MSELCTQAPADIGVPRHGPVVLTTSVGAAIGSKAAAAALACAASEADRAGLLIELASGRAPRPALIATAAARELEERLAVHLPQSEVASRGQLCQLTLSADPGGLDGVAAALPAVRDSVAVVHLPPYLLQWALDEPRIRATGVLLRADLGHDRSLTALTVRDLVRRGLRIAVLKQSLGWIAARRALLGALPASGAGLPDRARARLIGGPDA
jgi:hypothetical protein